MNTIKKHKGGRKPKKHPSIYRYAFRLNEQENLKFLKMFKASGMNTKAKFIVSVLFEKEIKTVKLDWGTMEFHALLTHLFSQFRSVALNYNQVVKILHQNFTAPKAEFFLKKLEKQTIELKTISEKILRLTEDLKEHIRK